jgi:hypothetical protein
VIGDRQSVGDESFELLDWKANASADADRCELASIHELIDHRAADRQHR